MTNQSDALRQEKTIYFDGRCSGCAAWCSLGEKGRFGSFQCQCSCHILEARANAAH